jgi:hypothetical protein
MLLRTKEYRSVGPFKSATCPTSSCDNCVLMSGHDDAATAAVMGASAPEKSAIIGKAPTNRNLPLLLSSTPRASPSRPATCNQKPRIRLQNFRERLICNLERFRNRGTSAIFSVCLRGERRSLLVCAESPMNATPQGSHANSTQRFSRFPRFPLVTPSATCQAREHCAARQLTITTFGGSDGSIRESAAMYLERLRHNSPSASLWRAIVPSALARERLDSLTLTSEAAKAEQPSGVWKVRKDCYRNVKVSNMVHVGSAMVDVHLSKPTRLESIVASE